jgi:hypothetical protein
MPYIQPLQKKILSPDTLHRKVLLALEVLDPLSQSLVSGGLLVTATGLGRPLISLSGRFVWLDEGGTWPERISVEPVRLPFENEVVTPLKPPDLNHAKPQQRLVRIILRPTFAADFSNGVTAIRGRLSESMVAGSPIVRDAMVRLAWFDKYKNEWISSPKQSGVTNKAGEFAAFLRLQPGMHQEPDLNGRLVKVQLQFTRGNMKRTTPDKFPFLSDPASAGCIVDGQLLARDLNLGWAELQKI